MEIQYANYGFDAVAFTVVEGDLVLSHAATRLVNRLPQWWLEELNYPNKHLVYFSCFGTPPHLRRKGYGRKLLQAVKDYYEGCIVILEVRSIGEMSDEQLVEFYKSEGFEEINPKDGYVAYTTMAIEL